MAGTVGGALARWAADGRGAVLCCDFDGTLAPIVDDPDAATPLPGAVAALGALTARLQTVAVVSGRPASYLARHLGSVAGLTLVGLYGLERVVDGRVEESAEARRWRPAVAEAARRARADGPPSLHVEEKGATVALHWRRSPDAGAWAAGFARAEADRSGLVAHGGKMSVELRPPAGGDKGDVVRSLATGAAAVAFAGDDLGDLPAFDALDGLDARTLRIAVGGDEAPRELLARADAVAADPEELVAAMQAIAR